MMDVMPRLISDYFCVATSGPTIDGREIRASWLRDIAETYDTKMYEANLWYEHYRWGGNYGTLHSTKVEKDDDGSYRLYNRLIPSPQMQELNRSGQKLHSSIEVLTEFRGKKKAYQYGLGITDSPASVGTDRLAFSAGGEAPSDEELEMMTGVVQAFNANKIAEYKTRIPGVNQDHLEIFVSQSLPDLEFSKEKTIFTFNFSDLFGRKTETGNDDMNKEETTALVRGELKEFSKQFSAELLTTLSEKFGTGTDTPAENSPAPETNSETTPDSENVNFATAESVTELSGKVDGMKDKLDKIYTALDNESDDPHYRSEATGGDNNADQFDA